jgi:phage host-nuclease inhibitor protein Gam
MTPIEALISSIATAPGLAAAVVIVWMFNRTQERVESLRQAKEDAREKARLAHDAEMADKYAEIGARQIAATGAMVADIKESHRDIFHRQAEGKR